jgi:aldose 1-epimerase
MEPMAEAVGVRLRRLSPAGEGGFPGALEAQAEMLIGGPGELIVRYSATTDAPTHVNLASHPYFNLAGRAARSVGGHRLRVAAEAYLPIDAAAIPLGGPQPVAGAPFDLRSPRALGEVLDSVHPQLQAGDGLNHCFVLDRRGDPGPNVTLEDPSSGRRLEIWTDQPGMQVYTANGFDGAILDDEGRPFVRRQAVALEAQGFPNSPNRPDFPSTLLHPGQVYRSETRFRVSSF